MRLLYSFFVFGLLFSACNELSIKGSLTQDTNASKHELWLKIGGSNAVGWLDKSDSSIDIGDPRLKELSWSSIPKGQTLPHQASTEDMSLRRSTNGNINVGLTFGRERLRLNPEIEELVILHRGKGKKKLSFFDTTSKWGKDNLELIREFLDAHPEFIFKGMLFLQGESDAERDEHDTYRDKLRVLVGHYRTAIPGGESSIFIASTMLQDWIEGSTTNSHVPSAKAIDEIHRDVPNILKQADFVDMSDQTGAESYADPMHFSAKALRIIGARMAAKAQGIELQRWQPCLPLSGTCKFL